MALSLGQTFWELERRELENVGIKVIGYEDAIGCKSAHDIYLHVPREFRGKKFQGGTLRIEDEGGVLMESGLGINDIEDTIYGDEPFYGVAFCLRKSLASSARIYLSYGFGEHTTEVILINGISEWLN